MKKIFPSMCIAALIALAACDMKLFSTINLSDILSPDNKTITADLRVNVTSCTENDINKLQKELEKRNIVAHFNACEEDFLDDYASFSTPLKIIKGDTETMADMGDIYLRYDGNSLMLQTSERLKSLLKSDTGVGGEVKISSIEFALINDTQNTISIKPFLVFANNKAVLSDIIEMVPYQKVHIKLSDVASQLLNESNAKYQVFEIINDNPESNNQRQEAVIELN